MIHPCHAKSKEMLSSSLPLSYKYLKWNQCDKKEIVKEENLKDKWQKFVIIYGLMDESENVHGVVAKRCLRSERQSHSSPYSFCPISECSLNSQV